MADRSELGQNIGRDVQVLKGPKGHLAFYGRHKTKDGFRAGIICDDENAGKNNGTIGGHRYFTCKPGQGLLVDPKKVQLLVGDEAAKKVWLTRAKHIKKLNRAFDRLMRNKEQTAERATGAVEIVREEGDGEVGKIKIQESHATPDPGPLNRPTPAKGEAVQRMESVLKESRKSVKKGGLNKYAGSVIDVKRDRSKELKEAYDEAGAVSNASNYTETLFKASEATAEETRARAAARAAEVLTIKQLAERAELERQQEEKQAAEDAELEALTAAEEAEIIKAAERESEQLLREEEEYRAVHAEFEKRTGGISRLSLKKTGDSRGGSQGGRAGGGGAHPLLAMVDEFVGGGGDTDSIWMDDE